jgi:hypothetical protein
MSRTDQHQPAPDRDAVGDADALNAYLDRLTGAQSEPAGDLSPDLRQAATQLFALAAVAGPPDSANPTQESTMNANALSPLSLDPVTTRPRATRPPTTRPSSIRRLWTRSSRAAQVASTAAVVLFTLLASLGVFRAFDPSGGDGDKFYGAVPVATVPDDAVTSSIPYPTAAECTATPRTREEVAAILRTPPADPTWGGYEPGDTPDKATADEVLATYRHWQACALKGSYYEFSAELMTDEAVRHQFYGNPNLSYGSPDFAKEFEPLSDAAIDELLDVFDREMAVDAATPSSAATPFPDVEGAILTMFPEDMNVGSPYSPLPAGQIQIPGTPIPGSPQQYIHARAYWVEDGTREIQILAPTRVVFANADGQWLVAGTWEERVLG